MEDRKGGFPHSEMSGSKGARASPDLIAACHVLLRLSTPRHPSGALIRLIDTQRTSRAVIGSRPCGPTPSHNARSLVTSCQTMFFIKSALKALETPGKPFLHNVNHQTPMREPGETCSAIDRSPQQPSRAVIKSPQRGCEMVEPDGLEPTTSCLQSTRSTN